MHKSVPLGMIFGKTNRLAVLTPRETAVQDFKVISSDLVP